MKNIFIIYVLFFSVGCISCQDKFYVEESMENLIELSKEELLSICYEDSTKLSVLEVYNILESFLHDNALTRSSENVEMEILGTSELMKNSRCDESTLNNLIYKILVTIGGQDYIALVSGNDIFPYVLAFYNRESDKFDDAEIIPIDYSMEVMLNNIRYINLLEDSLQNSTIQKVCKELNIDAKDYSYELVKDRISLGSNTRAKIVTNPPSDAIAGNGPFVNVSWNCGMPYNKLMAQNCSDNWLWDYRYPISSVVVATAQIMSCFKPSMSIDGTTIDWKYLCEKEEIHDTSDYFGSYTKDPDDKCMMIAKLMKYIGEQCGVIYQCNSSSVNFANVINFLNRYGIYVDEVQNMNVTRLKASVDELRPVFMYGQTSSGGGHWWIVDGYRTQVATRGTFFPGFNVYMHANMGKGKSYTGYYLVDSNGSLTFDTSFAHFNTNLRMYTNVRNYK